MLAERRTAVCQPTAPQLGAYWGLRGCVQLPAQHSLVQPCYRGRLAESCSALHKVEVGCHLRMKMETDGFDLELSVGWPLFHEAQTESGHTYIQSRPEAVTCITPV